MDTILSSFDILDISNWVHFKLYKNPNSDLSWKPQLDWYHTVLIKIVKPVVDGCSEIRATFFGIYGPEPYGIEEEEDYERKLPNQNVKTTYVRLRLSTKFAHKNHVSDELVKRIESDRNLVWDYEILRTFKGLVPGIIDRYGSKDDHQTLLFIRYWDAACRYILSILTIPGNWKGDVDVWGIPHLVNNSVGSLLRHYGVNCPICKRSLMYLVTCRIPLQNTVNINELPAFLLLCPSCYHQIILSSNI